MELLIGLGALILLGKVLIFKEAKQINAAPNKNLSAEEVIKCRGMRPEVYKELMRETIIDYTRDKEVEEAYRNFVDKFKLQMKLGCISRGKILGIKEYLNNNIKGYEKKKFKNDAHAIYTMLKASDLQVKHIETIKKFIIS